ncbi:HigA family addiction module antitoxin [Actinotignum timonense]|uniref:HigA family addiction module antitoxin n=1 Tax=Actinotignum timonense TaxID=1870995 RepID=A0AAW9HKE0_9ACTO|nr:MULTISPECIES: HigA family addiction module antitoxin [Actinotignum]AIE81940.1 plasmid maintenance system antidote protein [Actinotignum schaalii]MDK6589546.1 HigA family addiction module antitoxin [Actinotignum timonense]MDK6630297.1 HigA family addiction module antitoxin [Actinotignum timonense]MDY5140765.1 HigA family addiction module antitoxin [Actinotignum timonense]WQN45605.1 HigA family addiction module antitoxin [Actinotignum schaalii]
MSISATTTNQYLSTPGEILKEEFLEPLGITPYRLAKTIGASQTSIGEIISGKRSISVSMAFRLSKALGTTPQFWVNLQRDFDILSFDASEVESINPLVA